MGRLSIMRCCVALCLCVFLAGCETTDPAVRKAEAARQAEEAARLRAAYLARIHQVESEVWETLDPLMRAAADYRANETFGYVGAVFVTHHFYGEALEPEAREEGFGPYVSVLAVMPDSPAESAGLRPGDRVVSVNGVKAPVGDFAVTFATKKLKRLLTPDEVNAIEVARGGETLTLPITPVKGSYYGVVIVPGDSVAAQADGEVIWIGLSFAESLRNSDRLAYVCAYALARNVMRHSRQIGKNTFFGQVLDIAAMASGINTGGAFSNMGSKAYENAFDVEADLIALYLLASAGYEFAGYPDFWEAALAQSNRKGGLKRKQAERIAIARRVTAGLLAKTEAGEPIFPEAYLAGDVTELEEDPEPPEGVETSAPEALPGADQP